MARPGNRCAAVLVAGALVASGCTSDGPETIPSDEVSTSSTDVVSPSATTSATPEPEPAVEPAVDPDDLDVGTAVAAVDHLAGRIGPRHATSPAFRRAADWVSAQLAAHGLDVRRQGVSVPGGNSWGVPVAAGRSANVIATPPGFDGRRPHLVVGAHLDTVPQAPGAEDNASGIGVLLATAEALAGRRTRLPVVLVAFGAEEPRGPTDADHHYGSRAYVASLAPAERRAVRGMISLDRVGVGSVVPIGAAEGQPDRSSCAPPSGPGCRSRRRPASAPATTGRSCGPGCRGCASAARRTPSTTAPPTCPGSSNRRSCAAAAGWCSPGSPHSDPQVNCN